VAPESLEPPSLPLWPRTSRSAEGASPKPALSPDLIQDLIRGLSTRTFRSVRTPPPGGSGRGPPLRKGIFQWARHHVLSGRRLNRETPAACAVQAQDRRRCAPQVWRRKSSCSRQVGIPGQRDQSSLRPPEPFLAGSPATRAPNRPREAAAPAFRREAGGIAARPRSSSAGRRISRREAGAKLRAVMLSHGRRACRSMSGCCGRGFPKAGRAL